MVNYKLASRDWEYRLSVKFYSIMELYRQMLKYSGKVTRCVQHKGKYTLTIVSSSYGDGVVWIRLEPNNDVDLHN